MRHLGVTIQFSLLGGLSVYSAVGPVGGAVALFPLVLDYGNIDAGYQPFYGQNGVCLPLYIHEPYMDQGWIFSLIIFVVMPFTASLITIGLYFAIFHHLRKSRPQAYGSRSESCYLRKVLVITISNNISWATIIVTKILALSMVSIPGTSVSLDLLLALNSR